jgi:hypothetical protein
VASTFGAASPIIELRGQTWFFCPTTLAHTCQLLGGQCFSRSSIDLVLSGQSQRSEKVEPLFRVSFRADH